MPRSRFAVLVLGTAIVALVSGGGLPPRALAQVAATTTFEIPLHSAYLGIRTTATGRPDVRVLASGGQERIRVVPSGPHPTDGHWIVSLATGPNPYSDPPVLLRPGDEVVARIDGQETRVRVPDMTATADAATDTVTGRLPAGIVAAVVLTHRDPELFGELPDPAGVAVFAGPGGAVTAYVGDRIDLRPGVSGNLAYVSPEGHVVAVPFAVPIAVIGAASYSALVQADAGARAAIALIDADGAELARSGIAIELGGGLSAIGLAQGGDVVAGLFTPRPGQRVALLIDERVVATATVPLVTAVVDRTAREVRGRAPAGSRVALRLRGNSATDAPVVTGVVTATESGDYAVTVQSLDLEHDASVEASAWPGDAFRWLEAGSVPHVEVALWSDQVSGVAEARGEVRVEYRSADGAVSALAIGETAGGGAFSVRLPLRDGTVAVAPGDVLAIGVDGGAATEIVVPAVSVSVDAATRILAGRAPSGAEVRATTFAAAPDVFSTTPYDEPSTPLSGRADSDGAFALACADDACGTRYGRLTADTGAARFVLHWLDEPIYGLGVTAGSAVGRATAGTAVAITPLAPDGSTGATVDTIARPSPDGALPGFSLELRDVFPDGLVEGTRLRVTIAGAARDLQVPRFDWSADVLADRVRGNGPPLGYVFLVALATAGGPVRPDSGQAGALVGVDGRWEIPLQPFDLRAGDELYLFVFADGYYLEWRDYSVVGPAEPTPEPTQDPPAPSATPPAPMRWRAYLPSGWR